MMSISMLGKECEQACIHTHTHPSCDNQKYLRHHQMSPAESCKSKIAHLRTTDNSPISTTAVGRAPNLAVKTLVKKSMSHTGVAEFNACP